MGPDRYSEVTVLTRQQCLQLLGSSAVGRIGASIDALPVILPVHFALFDESVLFRTLPGTKLDAATREAVIAFQADAYQPGGMGWSVLVQGLTSAIRDRDGDARTSSIPIKPWVGVEPHHRLVRLDTTNVTGRRFRIAGEGAAADFPDAPQL
jgi:uncharacterized protein